MDRAFDLIRRSQCMVIDLTHISLEMMLELGFAAGLGLTIMPFAKAGTVLPSNALPLMSGRPTWFYEDNQHLMDLLSVRNISSSPGGMSAKGHRIRRRRAV